MIKQVNVFLENQKGRLASLCHTLSDEGFNMRSMNIADTSDFGVVRILCDKPVQAAEMLKSKGYRASVTDLMAIRILNTKGGLASFMELTDSLDVNIEYAYCFAVNDSFAVDVFKSSNTESLDAALANAGFTQVNPEEIYTLD